MKEKECFPNLFVPGFAKSGTSHLCAVLNSSRDIFLPAEKEPHFFADDLVPVASRIKRKSYLGLYSKANSRYRLDGSISYMYSGSAFRNIVAECHEPIFLILVRHPYDRMVSHYKFNVRNGVEQRSFPEALRNFEGLKKQWVYDYCEMSDYGTQLKRLLATVSDSSRVKLIDYDKYCDNPNGVVRSIAEYLDVEIPCDEMLAQGVNVSKRPKFQFVNNLMVVDSYWKSLFKSAIPFRLRRSIKKYIHNVNISSKDIVYKEDSYTDELRQDLSEKFSRFQSEYSELYID